MPATWRCSCGMRVIFDRLNLVCPKCGLDAWGKPARQSRQRPKQSPLCFGTDPLGAQRTDNGVILTLPLVPTKNGEPGNYHAINTMRQHWQGLVRTAWMMAGRPRYEKITLRQVFYLQRINRDYDNNLGDAWKGAQDGLKGTMLRDDRAKFLTLERPEMVRDRDNPRTELHIIEERNESI